MTDQLLSSLMSSVIKYVVSFGNADRDQGSKAETRGFHQGGVDVYEVIDHPLQPHEPPQPEATTGPQEIVCKPSQHAHLDPQMMSEKYRGLMEAYKVVSKERDDLQVSVQRMESQYADHLQCSKSTVNVLQDQLAATRAELVQVRQDLQASRSFLSTEASDGGKTLADMLSVLNQKIDEFAYVVGDLVPSHLGEAPFTPPNTEKGLASMRSLETLGSFAIQTNLSLADVLQYGIQHKTCDFLLDIIFTPFAPGIDRSLDHHLSELHRSLSLHYPQAHGGRWRAMTYSHIRPQDLGVPGEARWWVERVLEFVDLCAPGCHHAKDALPTKALEKAEEMLNAAIAVQDKASITYLAYNYEVFAVDLGSGFDEREMNYGGDDRKKQRHGEVVAVLGLGLKAWRSVCGDEGQYVKEQVIPVRASVLTAVYV